MIDSAQTSALPGGDSMCMNDWRIGRLIRSKRTFITSSVVDGFTIGASMDRVGIMFTLGSMPSFITDSLAPSIGAIKIDADDSTVGQLNAVVPSVIYTLATHGELPTLRWSTSDLGASVDVVVVEWFMPEQYLAVALKQFETEYKP